MKTRREHSSGLTLVEIMVALVILMISVLPIMVVIFRESQSVTQTFMEFNANMLAQDLMERVRRCRWDELSTTAGPVVTANATIGQDIPGVFDDVDDWHGFTDTAGRYTRTVSVDFVTVNTITGVVSVSGLPTDIKRIRVVVSAPGWPDIRLVSLAHNVAI